MQRKKGQKLTQFNFSWRLAARGTLEPAKTHLIRESCIWTTWVSVRRHKWTSQIYCTNSSCDQDFKKMTGNNQRRQANFPKHEYLCHTEKHWGDPSLFHPVLSHLSLLQGHKVGPHWEPGRCVCRQWHWTSTWWHPDSSATTRTRAWHYHALRQRDW